MDKTQTKESVAVVAVRAAEVEGIEVLLLREPGATRYWFPNSCVQPNDTTAKVVGQCRGITTAMARKYLHQRKPIRRCLGHWVAASRELFVRTGILFCTHGDSHAQVVPETYSRLVAQRALVDREELDFATLLEIEDVFCDLKSLVPFTKWLDFPNTDRSRAQQIFLARVYGDAPASSRSSDDVVGDWIVPEAAMVQWRQGQISLDFMTFGCLRTLTDFQNTESLFTEYRLID